MDEKKKYIIELDDNTLAYTAILIDGVPYIKPLKLLPYTEPDMEQVRKEAYDKCMGDVEMLAHKLYSPKIDGAYQRGLNDAWECARKIDHMSDEDIKNVFGCGFSAVFETIGVSECIKKIRQYEQEKEEQIQVGDEVITASGKAVVMGVGPVHFEYVNADGSGYDEVKNVKKTGRHFPEIAEVLRKMKEAE